MGGVHVPSEASGQYSEYSSRTCHTPLVPASPQPSTMMCPLSCVQPEGVVAISSHFPFHEYFASAPQPLFKEQSYAEDMDIAEVSLVEL